MEARTNPKQSPILNGWTFRLVFLYALQAQSFFSLYIKEQNWRYSRKIRGWFVYSLLGFTQGHLCTTKNPLLAKVPLTEFQAFSIPWIRASHCIPGNKPHTALPTAFTFRFWALKPNKNWYVCNHICLIKGTHLCSKYSSTSWSIANPQHVQ